ncbi:MAG TPA: hypothetical protein VMS71_04115, partial [Candidatus Acidoferrum sp.]|nr:hypothetical protein [Candidatus Acidoferrum sp.]
MNRIFKAMGAILFVVVAAACAWATPPDSARIAEARKGIDEGNAKWIEAHRESNAKMLASLFAPDGAFLLKGGEILQGKENIEKE